MPAPAFAERLGLLSTYPPQRCGIGTYTAALAKAIAAQGQPLTVLAEQGAAAGENGAVRCVPCFTRADDFGPAVLAASAQAGLRLVHLQHAPDILGMDDRLIRLLQGLRAQGTRTAVTLHTVFTPWSGALERRFGVARFHRRLAAAADAIVVHGDSMTDELARQGVPRERVHVIPHGTTNMDVQGVVESRRRLGLPEDGPLMLYFGFIHIQKNLHTVVRALARLARRDVRLLIAGSIQNRAWFNRAYLQACRFLVRAYGLRDRVVLREGFVAPDEVPFLYGASQLVVLPYAQRYGSASGVVHNALGAGRVMVCSDSPKFQEIAENISPRLIVSTHDAGAWAERIDELLGQADEMEQLSGQIRRYATATSWERVAESHRALYVALLGTDTPASVDSSRSRC